MTKNKFILLFLCLILLLIASFFLALSYGNAQIPLDSIVDIVINHLVYGIKSNDENGALYDIIWLLRMPRIILAICVGAGLSVCGVVMQAIVKNPLADPYILGISSGASLGATAAVLLGIGSTLGENFIGISAFMGALGISFLVLFIANLGGPANSVKLLLAGMALSAICSAFSSFIVYFANNMEGIQTITYWLMGSLAGASWTLLSKLVPLILVCILLLWSQAKILNLMLLGDDTAITLGYNLQIYRQSYLLITSLMIGTIVYASGVLGFVGLLIPHLVRMLIGTDHKFLIPVSAIIGAIFLIVCDLCCRIILPRAELPIGLLISLIGAPTFIYMMIRKTYSFGSK